MTTNDLQPKAAGRAPLEIALLAASAAAVLFSLISISLVQGFWFLALLVWAYLLIRKDILFSVPAFFWPLLLYVSLSLAAAAASIDRRASVKDSRDLLIVLLVPLVVAAFRRLSDLKFPLTALFLSGTAASVLAIIQFAGRERPDQRIKGFMGHYMTQAGLLGLFIAFAMAQALFAKGKARLAWTIILAPSGAALVMTLTRNAWLGVGAAAVLLLGLWNPKALIVAPVLAVLLYFAGPEIVKSRVRSIFDRRDPSNIARIEYARAGLKIIGQKPIFGTGPDTVDELFQDPAYGLGDYARRSVHLHNNYLQIAAERGIPALAAWLAFLAVAGVHLLRRFRTGGPAIRPLAAGGLAALALLLVAGFFEYNFGDSEVAQLFLLLLALPFGPEADEPSA
ncbi:MAG: O-antigen ligase family protein [Candidatus Aminicenantes bacterium]|nr:O-antigen ligase family protein [Candidatus Aminicenantes bacterium]